ncbi:MAG: hypothetical protein ACO38V_12135 [Phycisphaerales bacterium]
MPIRSAAPVSALLLASGIAVAQETPSSPPAGIEPSVPTARFAWDVPASGEWDLVLGAWLPRFEGKLRWGSSGTEFEANDLDLDDLEASFAGDLSWRNEWVRATIGGFDFSTSGAATLAAGSVVGGTTFSSATAATTAASMWSVGGQVAVTLWRPFASRTALWNGPVESPAGLGPNGSSVDLSFECLLALRYLSLSQSVTTATTSAVFDQSALGIGIGGGIRFRGLPAETFTPMHGLDIFATAAAGPAVFGGGSFVQLETGIEWEVCPNFAARFGYRLLDWTIEADGDRSAAGLQGLFVGGRLTF